jgi:hypothetical protein
MRMSVMALIGMTAEVCRSWAVALELFVDGMGGSCVSGGDLPELRLLEGGKDFRYVEIQGMIVGYAEDDDAGDEAAKED